MKKRLNIFDLLMENWWLRHGLFWILYMIYNIWGMQNVKQGETINLEYVSRKLAFLPGFILVVYLTLYFLIPKYLVNKKFIRFILGYSLVIGIAILYAMALKLNFSTKDNFEGVSWKWGKNVLPFVHVTAVAAFLKMMRYAFLQERRENLNKNLKNLAELELLKAQIHPHFLFNTLNNLFAHTLRKSSQSSRIVLKLSDLLRFMVYESREDEIELKKEIKLLTDYIDLEKLRYGDELDISVNFSGNIEGKTIRPLLLMPLIENSFKHGTSQQLDQKWVSLHLHVEGDILEFNLANSRDSDQKEKFIPGKSKGIGLVNVQRRLELLYPGSHQFKITTEKDRFLVYLKLTVRKELQSVPTSEVKNISSNPLIFES
jgi:sensor histidine kinase YesM